MPRVQNMNVILDIEDDEVQHYMARGFNLIDVQGNILEKSMPQDVTVLQQYYREHLAKIAELEAKVAELSAQLVVATEKPKKSTKKTTSE